MNAGEQRGNDGDDGTDVSRRGDRRPASGGFGDRADAMRRLFAIAEDQADVLVICGDITAGGRPEQLRGVIDARVAFDVPVVAVLGNHDHEADAEDDVIDVLTAAGVDVLDGMPLVVGPVGFAGVKGFGGGFSPRPVEPCGERTLQEFVAATVTEAEKLEAAIAALRTSVRVVLMHYSPIAATLVGEPESLWPVLGSSRFEAAIDRLGADVVFHGHAHLGVSAGATRGGTPVFNVATPVLQREGIDLRLWEVAVPTRPPAPATGEARRA